jgi:hypothetical protein
MAPPSHARSHFLALPAELRVMIYKFALSYEDGLFSDNYPRFYVQRKDTFLKMTPNALKLVCRQFRDDTKGILLRVNDTMTFRSCVQGNVEERFADHISDRQRLVSTAQGDAPPYGFQTMIRFMPILRTPICRNLKRVNISLESITTKDHHTLVSQLVDRFVEPTFRHLEAFCKRSPHVRVFLLCRHCPGSMAKQQQSHRNLATVMDQLRGLNFLNSPIPVVFLGGTPLTLAERIATTKAHFATTLTVLRFRLEGFIRQLPRNLRVSLSAEPERKCFGGHPPTFSHCPFCLVERCSAHVCKCVPQLAALQKMFPNGC